MLDNPRKRDIAGQQLADIRRKNESAVLSLLRREDGLPSSVVAKKTGLAAQTISIMLRNLEDRGLVRRGQSIKGRRGQPAIPLHLEAKGAFSIGISLGWRQVDIVLVNLLGETMHSARLPYARPNSTQILAIIKKTIDDMLCQLECSAAKFLLGAGLARPWFGADYSNGFGLARSEQDYLNSSDFVADMGNILGVPVHAVNKGSAACLAEYSFGCMPPETHMGYFYLSTFLSAGIQFNGHVSEGQNGYHSQMGSVMVGSPQGGVKPLYKIASLLALEDYLTAQGHEIAPNLPLKWDWDALSESVDSWMDNAAAALAVTVYNSSTALGLSAHVLDGVLPKPIMAELAKRVEACAQALDFDGQIKPRVMLGQLGHEAPARGAAYSVLNHHLFSV